jgi:hypothetical protein
MVLLRAWVRIRLEVILAVVTTFETRSFEHVAARKGCVFNGVQRFSYFVFSLRLNRGANGGGGRTKHSYRNLHLSSTANVHSISQSTSLGTPH